MNSQLDFNETLIILVVWAILAVWSVYISTDKTTHGVNTVSWW